MILVDQTWGMENSTVAVCVRAFYAVFIQRVRGNNLWMLSFWFFLAEIWGAQVEVMTFETVAWNSAAPSNLVLQLGTVQQLHFDIMG